MMKAVNSKGFYKNLPRLETVNLILRIASIQDVADIFVYSSDEQVTRYLRWGPHQTVEETKNYIHGVLMQYREGQDGPWVIEYKLTGSVIGHIHLMDIDEKHLKAQVGFVLSRRYWNKGFSTEALIKVLEYSFSALGLNRVEAFCVRENRAAKRVLEKAGMKKEGVLKEYQFQKGCFYDFIVYAILRDYFQKPESA